MLWRSLKFTAWIAAVLYTSGWIVRLCLYSCILLAGEISQATLNILFFLNPIDWKLTQKVRSCLVVVLSDCCFSTESHLSVLTQVRFST